MKFKKEYLILLVVIIGLCAYLYSRRTDRTLYELPDLPEVSAKKISKIEIAGPDEIMVLNRTDESWTIGSEEYPASDNKVKQMLESIADLTLTALISESKNYVRYDLTDTRKISVQAWSGDTLSRAFDIGKTDSSLKHTFVMFAGDPKVYQASDNIRNKFDKKIQDIRDKSVMSFTAGDIREIQLVKGDRSVTLVRQETPAQNGAADKSGPEPAAVWQTPDGKKANGSKLDSLLSTLSQLECDDYITDRGKADFSEPIFAIAVKGAKSYSLSLYAQQEKDAKSYPAASSENGYPFLLPEWRVKILMPEFDELLEEKDPS